VKLEDRSGSEQSLAQPLMMLHGYPALTSQPANLCHPK
jgi:hypothetical protein